ncbi:hypothetical protein LUZ61_004850 [Rhynchospora tenuis]|uniref:Uncharacterized protein n=1 Tax=Rhynchospora tenuis TaxID=198213 RepID=A0AAD5ZNP3_9POAL|nr:hypothetical protein LUZ61_004850 [Rhynchospora tenuis]
MCPLFGCASPRLIKFVKFPCSKFDHKTGFHYAAVWMVSHGSVDRGGKTHGSKRIDGSHSFSFRNQDKHIAWKRLRAFYIESPFVLLTETLHLPISLRPPGTYLKLPIELFGLSWKRLRHFYIESPFVHLMQALNLPSWLPPLPGTYLKLSLELFGFCSLDKVRTGIWISEHQVARCHCSNTCAELVHVLDARHLELFLEEGYKNGRWQYEEIGYDCIPFHQDAAIGAIFDLTRMWSPTTSQILTAKSWAGPAPFKAKIGSHAVAYSTELAENDGILVRYQVMKDDNGKLVSLRISTYVI